MYSREIDGKTLTLAPSGWTYNYTFVLYDKETNSLWYPDDDGLIGIQGVYFKRQLPEIPSSDTSWKEWKEKHPNSQVLN